MRAVALGVCFWLLWLPQAAFAWSLNVPPGAWNPNTNIPIGMWYLHPDIHLNNVPGNNATGVALSVNVPAGNDGASLRSQLVGFGFGSVSDPSLLGMGNILMDDGVNYVIQSTPYLRDRGLGFVLQFRTRIISTNRHTIGTQTNSWTPVTTIASNVCPSDWVSLNIGNGTQQFTVQVDMDIRIHWIRLANQDLNTTGNQITVNSGASNTRIFNVRLMTGSGGCSPITIPGQVGNQAIYQFWQTGHVYRAPVQSCTTPQGPTKLVNLGMNFQSEFTGIGSTTAPKEFQFTVHCPSGYNAIRFWVGSPYRVASDPDGVVRLDPTSTASGFGVKIWDGPGTGAQPLKFDADNTYLVHGYTEYEGLWLDPNSPTGDDRDQANANWIWERGSTEKGNLAPPNYGQPSKDYNIRMKAALYQTEATVTPGAYKTHILIYLVYK